MERKEFKAAPPLTLVFEGKEYPVKRLKLGMQREYEREIAKAKETGSGSAEVMFGYLSRCGVPEEVSAELDADQLTELVQWLSSPSKKN